MPSIEDQLEQIHLHGWHVVAMGECPQRRTHKWQATLRLDGSDGSIRMIEGRGDSPQAALSAAFERRDLAKPLRLKGASAAQTLEDLGL